MEKWRGLLPIRDHLYYQARTSRFVPQNISSRQDNNWNDEQTHALEQARTDGFAQPGRNYARAVQEGTRNNAENTQERPRRNGSRQNLSRQVSQNNLPLHQHISLQRKRSFRREGNTEERMQSEITKLQLQLNDMRGTTPPTTQIQHHNRDTREVSQNNTVQTTNHSIPKNVNNAQSSNTGTNHEDIKEALLCVSSAMETLKKFEMKFATILNTYTTHTDRS